MLGSVQMCGVLLSSVETNDICESLQAHNVRLLSLRECTTSDKDFKKLMKSVGKCKSILQMNLNLGLVSSSSRLENLCQAMEKNRSLTTLMIHGSPLGDEGATRLAEALSTHPNIIALDVSDCQIGDKGLQYIADLLPPDGAKPGLEELTLSVNPSITTKGWIQFFIALASTNTLRSLCLDYNGIGDCGAGCLAVAVAASNRLEILDLESTGITDFGAKIFLHLLANYPVPLKQVVLTENRIRQETITAINSFLDNVENESEISDSQSTSSKTSWTESSSTQTNSRRSSTSTVKGSDTSSQKFTVKSQSDANDAVTPTVDFTEVCDDNRVSEREHGKETIEHDFQGLTVRHNSNGDEDNDDVCYAGNVEAEEQTLS